MVVDLFAGGGGASLGVKWAFGKGPDVAVNHDEAAILMHKANHPETHHEKASVWEIHPAKTCGGRPVSLLWMSPDCRHFSRAKGASKVSPRVRTLARVRHPMGEANETSVDRPRKRAGVHNMGSPQQRKARPATLRSVLPSLGKGFRATWLQHRLEGLERRRLRCSNLSETTVSRSQKRWHKAKVAVAITRSRKKGAMEDRCRLHRLVNTCQKHFRQEETTCKGHPAKDCCWSRSFCA